VIQPTKYSSGAGNVRPFPYHSLVGQALLPAKSSIHNIAQNEILFCGTDIAELYVVRDDGEDYVGVTSDAMDLLCTRRRS
jgi:hypothetical protein